MEFKQGDLIFNQGDLGDYAYLIESGKVEIYQTKKNGQIAHLAFLGEGELFGEMALFDANVRTASTRAASDCNLLRIKKEQLFERVNQSDKIVQLIIRVLMKRLQQSNLTKIGEAAAISPVIRTEAVRHDKSDGDALEKLKFENELNEAFLKNEFKIFHQPIVEMASGKITGSEALIRWESPQKGLVSPGKFVDILENSAMIIPVGYWIIEQCFINYLEIKKRKPGIDFSISINVSGRQFLHFDFISKLKELLKKHQVPAHQFKLEITERILLEGGGIIDILDKCAEMGFSISLDDFGTGFSSLQYLARMPISFIKIDRSFVMNIQKDEKTLAVVSSIIFLAKKLNIKIISEGIETAEEKQIMQDLGSEFGQGYLFAKPVSFNEFLALL